MSLAIAVLCCFLLFAAVGCCLLPLPWICFGLLLFATCVVAEWCQNAPRRPQNACKMHPKWPLGAPWTSQVEPKSYFVILGSILEPNLVPNGTPKSTKNRYFARKMLQGARFQGDVGLARCFTSSFIAFLIIFGRKIDGKISTLLCFLPSFPTLEKPCNLRPTLPEDSVFGNMLKS